MSTEPTAASRPVEGIVIDSGETLTMCHGADLETLRHWQGFLRSHQIPFIKSGGIYPVLEGENIRLACTAMLKHPRLRRIFTAEITKYLGADSLNR